jgi:response regulator RpfG family c-di-GMP phosphodiesterase
MAGLRVAPGPAGTSAALPAVGEPKRSVLVVDDEPGVRHLMRRWLESRGYLVAVAPDADQALDLLAAAPAAVALCDVRMPGHDGLWLAGQLRREHPDTAVIIATGFNDVSAVVDSLRQGIVDYLTKPFERDRLCQAVSRGIEWHKSARDARQWRERLEREVGCRRAHLAEVVASQFVDSDDDLDVLLATLTATHPDVYAHACRVAALSAAIARTMGLPGPEIAVIERGALLHEVGKLAMPDAVLRKPAPLTAEELRLVQHYPAIGYELVAPVAFLAGAAEVVRDLQERIDGQGYPGSRRADDIAPGAKIVAVADAYDTMTRARVFRDAMPPADAVAEIARSSGTQFDPRVVDAFLTAIGRA